MMLKLQPNPTFVLTCRISVPGQANAVELPLVFRHKGRKELQQWLLPGRPNVELLGEVIDGFSGPSPLRDGEGQPVPYSTAALEALFDAYPASPLEILDEYVAELSEGRLKNSGWRRGIS